MDKRQFTRISKALADPRRFEILQSIAEEDEMACSALKECQSISAATLSHHIKELKSAGLVDIRRESKYLYMQLHRPVWKAYLKELKKIGS
jgi:ArsR family transcriptional regulator